MIVILTLANKPDYLPDALASVEAQTRRDFVHVVELDDGSRDWGGRYPPAVFYNEQARQVSMQDYVCWLSDDDLLLPNYVAGLAGYLDEHPRAHCVYGVSRVVLYEPNREPHLKMMLPKAGLPVFNRKNLPGFKIDSGQVMVRRSALERVPYPYAPETGKLNVSRRADGHLLNNIARATPLYPVDSVVMVNRVTPAGSHRRCVGGRYVGHDWRKVGKYGE